MLIAIAIALAYIMSPFAGADDTAARVRAAFADWGHTAPLAVTVSYADLGPKSEVVAYAVLWETRPTACHVVVTPRYYTVLPPEYRQRAITHEVGHCLGLGHHGGPGVMGPDWESSAISPGERAAYRALWYPYRVPVPMAAR